jgi:serine phosphatase RsbU (regulator of sigma subunit)
MTVTPQTAPKVRRSLTRYRTVIVWLAALVTIAIDRQLTRVVARLHGSVGALNFFAFCAWLILISITLYWLAIGIRWVLRKLFWRVGRRLFLSYVLIGVLPFFLITILLFVIGYMIAGVMSQAALRGERQAMLGQMESWSLEYALQGKKPKEALPTLEIYDTDGEKATLPQWLTASTFSGLVWREPDALLVCSRQWDRGGSRRSIVFVQPLDEHWASWLEDKGGMITSHARATVHDPAKKKPRIRYQNATGDSEDIDIDGGENMKAFFRRAFGFDRVVWADLTELTDWQSGNPTSGHQLFTLLANPLPNLFQFYFGASHGQYVLVLVKVIVVITVLLLVFYLMAALFAAVLIFSISRAVNRIEKGTQAVERGDFSYRINMKPRNQLGQMAQSFDHMTESIGSLLTKVAEKERLQSEIDIAASIQRNLLPKEGPSFGGVSFSAHFEPTASIGGDYYDVFNLDGSHLAVTIGDVSGHGLSTGLVMAMVKAAITTLVEEGADEQSLFRRLNDLVHRSTERRAFMTLAFTIFDFERGRIRHTNAGHLYPYLLRRGQPPHAIESPSLPLGVRSQIVTRTVELDLMEGDAVVYLSDGIVEAQDERGEPFGFDQLEEVLTACNDATAPEIQLAILRAIALHSGTRAADDDRTVMVLRFDQLLMRNKVEAVAEPAVA